MKLEAESTQCLLVVGWGREVGDIREKAKLKDSPYIRSYKIPIFPLGARSHSLLWGGQNVAIPRGLGGPHWALHGSLECFLVWFISLVCWRGKPKEASPRDGAWREKMRAVSQSTLNPLELAARNVGILFFLPSIVGIFSLSIPNCVLNGKGERWKCTISRHRILKIAAWTFLMHHFCFKGVWSPWKVFCRLLNLGKSPSPHKEGL